MRWEGAVDAAVAGKERHACCYATCFREANRIYSTRNQDRRNQYVADLAQQMSVKSAE